MTLLNTNVTQTEIGWVFLRKEDNHWMKNRRSELEGRALKQKG